MIRARNNELGSLGCNLGSAWNSSKKKMKQNKTKNFGETSSRVHHDSRSVAWFIDVSTLAKTPLLLFQKPCFICFMSKRNLCLCSLALTHRLEWSYWPAALEREHGFGLLWVQGPRLHLWGTGATSRRVPAPLWLLSWCPAVGQDLCTGPWSWLGIRNPTRMEVWAALLLLAWVPTLDKS